MQTPIYYLITTCRAIRGVDDHMLEPSAIIGNATELTSSLGIITEHCDITPHPLGYQANLLFELAREKETWLKPE